MCPCCGQVQDSLSHRALECPGLDEAWEPFQDCLDQVVELHPSWVQLPCMPRHPEAWCLEEILHCLPQPELNVEIIRQHCHDQPPVFFTDGSCAHSDFPAARLSSGAVILDCARNDEERRSRFLAYKRDLTTPNTLVPVGFFVTPGLATINRAELQAVASCLSAFPVSTVFTDSAFVVATWEKVQNADNLAALHACDHFDLVAQLFHVRGTPGSVQKIQAHQVVENSKSCARIRCTGQPFG